MEINKIIRQEKTSRETEFEKFSNAKSLKNALKLMACNINERFGHNYIQGTCLNCGRSQKQIHKIAINPFKNYQFKKMSSDSGSQLATDLCEEFGGKFMFYRSVISKVGEQTVREWFSQCRQANPKYPKAALFASIFRKFWQGIIWS